jgi:hypothetical protein
LFQISSGSLPGNDLSGFVNGIGFLAGQDRSSHGGQKTQDSSDNRLVSIGGQLGQS